MIFIAWCIVNLSADQGTRAFRKTTENIVDEILLEIGIVVYDNEISKSRVFRFFESKINRSRVSFVWGGDNGRREGSSFDRFRVYRIVDYKQLKILIFLFFERLKKVVKYSIILINNSNNGELMRHVFDYIKKNPFLLVVIIPAFIAQMLIVMPSGTYLCSGQNCGLFFWGAHGHDSLWHLAIASVAFKTFPFSLPTFAGQNLQGYNYLFDLVIYWLSKFGIAPIITYFKIAPLAWFFLMTAATIGLGRKIKDSPIFIGLLLFFVYFGGSFGYVLTYLHKNTIFNSEGILAIQSGHSLINIQFAFSLVVLVYLFSIIHKLKSDNKTASLLAVLVFLNLGLKFYAGIITLFIVVLYYLWLFVKSKERITIILRFVPTLLAATVAVMFFYDPFNSLKSGSILIFSPFAIVHSMIEERDLFYLREMVDERYFLLSKGFGPRLFYIEMFSVFLYVIFNFGTRVIGLIYLLVKSIKLKLQPFEVILILTAIFSTALAVLFIQKGEWWNTVQFFYYAIFIMNIFAAEAFYEIVKKKNFLSIIAGLVIILATLPTSIDLVAKFTFFPSPSYLPSGELKALAFLKNLPDGTVLTERYDPNSKGKYKEPIPFHSYDDTSYVAAFSGKKTYMNDLVQLRLTGVDYSQRKLMLEKQDCDYLGDIRYLYSVRPDSFRGCLTKPGIKRIYEKDGIAIYEVLSALIAPK